MVSDVFIGLDGGSAKTVGAVCDAEARVSAHERAPACAIVGPVSAERSARLSALMEALCRQAGLSRASVRFCAVGLSGVDFADEHAAQLEGVAGALGLPAERVALVNDAVVALWGATAAPAAAILQHGSGVTSCYRTRHGEETLFDHLDVGRQFDMRGELIAQVARMIDGRVEPTPLKERVLSHLGVDDESAFHERIYRRTVPRDKVLSTPPLVFDAYLEGDPVARRIVEAAVEDYAATARTLVARTGDPAAEVAFGGGVLELAPDRFWAALKEAVGRRCPRAVVRRPEIPPEFGALVMAAFQAGRDAKEFFEHLAPQASRIAK
jgi:N-acetylglucosamine kinase-like BadF-type ATPase